MTPHTDTPRLTSTLRVAVRRRRIQLFIIYMSRSLILSALAALLVLTANRLFAIPVPDPLIITIAALGLPLGMWFALRHPISPLNTALILDKTHHLKNRISSAFDLTESSSSLASRNAIDPVSNAFNELTLLDAELSCENIEINNTFPVTWLRSSSYAIILSAILIVSIIWCPDLSGWFINNNRNEQLIARRNEELAAAQAIKEAEQRLHDLNNKLNSDQDHNNVGAQSNNDQTQQVLNTLNDLSSQLTSDNDQNNTTDTPDQSAPPSTSPSPPVPDPSQTVTQAAQTLNELAQQLDDSAEENQHIADTILERLNRITPPESITAPQANNKPEPSTESTYESLRKLAQALKQNDTEKAVEEIHQLQQQTQQQSPEENQSLAQELRKLADQIQPKQPDSTNPDKTNNQSSEKLPPQNNPQSVKQPDDNSSPEQQIEQETRRLEEQGLDPETARNQAEKQHQKNLTKHAEKTADDELKKTSEELRRWADELQNNRKTTPEQKKKNDAKDSRKQPGTTKQTNPENTPGNQTPSSTENPESELQPDKQSPSKDEQQSTPDKNTNPKQTHSKDTHTQKTIDKNQPGDNQPQNAVTPTADDGQNKNAKDVAIQKEDRNQQSQSSEQSPDQSPDQSPESQQPTGSQSSESQQPQDQPQQQTDGNQPANKDQPQSEHSETVRRLQEALRRMGSHKKQADQHRTVSEEAKKQARKLIENMTPDQREQLKRWMAQQQSPDTPPTPPNPNPNTSPVTSSPQNKTNSDNNTQPQNPSRTTSPATKGQSPYPYTIRDIDARNKTNSPSSSNDRVLSEWLHTPLPPPNNTPTNNTPTNPNAPTTTTNQTSRQLQPEAIKQATRAAQRALEEQAVAPRYRELLKKWTEQLTKQLRTIKKDTSTNNKIPSTTDTTASDKK